MEAPAHFGDLLQCILFPPGLGSVDGVVVERLAGKIHDLVEGETTVRPWLRTIPNGTRPGQNALSSWAPLRDRAWCRPMRRRLRRGSLGLAAGSLVRSSRDSTADEEEKAAAGFKAGYRKKDKKNKTKPSRSFYLVEIFGPFGVQVTVRFLCLWFENANDFLKKII